MPAVVIWASSGKNSLSAFSTASPSSGSAATSSPLARASSSRELKYSIWTIPTLVTIPITGFARAARRAMSPARCIPISSTRAEWCGSRLRMVRGTPVSVLRLPCVRSTLKRRERLTHLRAPDFAPAGDLEDLEEAQPHAYSVAAPRSAACFAGSAAGRNLRIVRTIGELVRIRCYVPVDHDRLCDRLPDRLG